MEKQEAIDLLITATNRALTEEKPEMIYAVVGALQRVAHAGILDADAHGLINNLNWSNGDNTENNNNEDRGSGEPNADGSGQEQDMGTSGQHQAERADQSDNSKTE